MRIFALTNTSTIIIFLLCFARNICGYFDTFFAGERETNIKTDDVMVLAGKQIKFLCRVFAPTLLFECGASL